MIKNIIFDFGDVFINLDKSVQSTSLNQYNHHALPEKFHDYCIAYEVGNLNTETFIELVLELVPQTDKQTFINAWNSILLNFPKERLLFLKDISKNYRCFLLSNTNELHINWIKQDWGLPLFNEFKSYFEGFYLSHEIGLRKPNTTPFTYILDKHNLNPLETLFIDDTEEHILTAKSLAIHTWNLIPKKEDVTDLLTIKKQLFV